MLYLGILLMLLIAFLLNRFMLAEKLEDAEYEGGQDYANSLLANGWDTKDILAVAGEYGGIFELGMRQAVHNHVLREKD